MNNNYLIPANSKKSQLILGFFTPIDFALFASGVGITLLLLMLIQNANMTVLMLILSPAWISGCLG